MLFSAPMILALLAGRKTVTRRLYTRVRAGDLIWCKETLMGGRLSFLRYAADGMGVDGSAGPALWSHKWKKEYGEKIPSIYMPRWASRITLQVIGVRDERLITITEAGAKAEGVERGVCTHPDCSPGSCAVSSYKGAYATLWDQINGAKAPWSSNPIVFRIAFRIVEK